MGAWRRWGEGRSPKSRFRADSKVKGREDMRWEGGGNVVVRRGRTLWGAARLGRRGRSAKSGGPSRTNLQPFIAGAFVAPKFRCARHMGLEIPRFQKTDSRFQDSQVLPVAALSRSALRSVQITFATILIVPSGAAVSEPPKNLRPTEFGRLGNRPSFGCGRRGAKCSVDGAELAGGAVG